MKAILLYYRVRFITDNTIVRLKGFFFMKRIKLINRIFYCIFLLGFLLFIASGFIFSTVDKAVSAAIMDAYGLLSAGELTAFLEDIARKHRQNSNDPDVMEFDYFIEWVRCSLDGTYATKLDEVKAEVLAKIDAYDTSSTVNSFNLNGLPVWLDKDTRVGLMNSTQIEKAAGHETTTLWLGSVSLVINCDLAIQMLSALELYALECYNKTAEHKANVGKLMSIEEVEAYDYTAGYPEKLDLNTSVV